MEQNLAEASKLPQEVNTFYRERDGLCLFAQIFAGVYQNNGSGRDTFISMYRKGSGRNGEPGKCLDSNVSYYALGEILADRTMRLVLFYTILSLIMNGPPRNCE
jgi:hypothetical protein